MPRAEPTTGSQPSPPLAELVREEVAEERAAPARHDPYAAIRHRDYRLFASGWVFASMGLRMQAMALGWEIYQRTEDPLHLGYVGLARALPVLALALPAGHLIDALDRRKVLLLTQVSFALVSGLIAWASWAHSPLWLFYLLIVLSGCTRVFNGPSRSSLLPQLVPPDAFHNAVTWNAGVFQLSAMIGPLVAGDLIARSGHEAWPVYVCTMAGCAVFGGTVAMMRPRAAPRPAPGPLVAGMTAGMRHVWREKTVLGALALDLFAVLLGGATALLPVYAEDILHVGPRGLGMLTSASYVGALACVLLLAHRAPFRRAGPTLLWSVAAFGVAMIVFGVSRNFWLSLGALFAAGAVDNVSVVVRHVLVQARTPDHLRGRVSAVNSVFIESSNEIGAFESGAVARVFGPVASVVSGGIGTVLVVGFIAWWLPELRRLGGLRMDEPIEEPTTAARNVGTAK